MKNTSCAIYVDYIDWGMRPLLVKLPAASKCPFFGQCDVCVGNSKTLCHYVPSTSVAFWSKRK
eukprot:1027527-Ditylum_brightwellii.AAC.1